MSSRRSKFIPCSSAICELAWITGPSAIGSENGRPSSITSAPASSSAARSSTLRPTSGWPAVIYGTKAHRFAARRSAKRRSICRSPPGDPPGDAPRDPPGADCPESDEIVTDANAISFRIFRLDDGAEEPAVGIAVGQVDELSGMQDVALRIADDTHDRAGKHVLQRIDRVDDAQLERIHHDKGADRIDAREVDERLHDHGIHAAAR